LYILNNINE